MRRRAAWTALLLLAAVLTGTPVQAATRSVTIRQYAYSPASLMVTVGDTVTWTNRDTAAHDVVTTSGPASFRSRPLATGESFRHTFTTAGTYQYYCSLHPDMRASVMVHAKAVPTTTAPQRRTTRAPARQTQISADRSATATATIGAAPGPAVSTAPPSAPGIAAGVPAARADLQPLAIAAVAAVLAALISLFALGTRP
ncbi:cupredoxin family copper-binding protein [Actinomycetes bacterium KLBMP 9797]